MTRFISKYLDGHLIVQRPDSCCDVCLPISSVTECLGQRTFRKNTEPSIPKIRPHFAGKKGWHDMLINWLGTSTIHPESIALTSVWRLQPGLPGRDTFRDTWFHVRSARSHVCVTWAMWQQMILDHKENKSGRVVALKAPQIDPRKRQKLFFFCIQFMDSKKQQQAGFWAVSRFKDLKNRPSKVLSRSWCRLFLQLQDARRAPLLLGLTAARSAIPAEQSAHRLQRGGARWTEELYPFGNWWDMEHIWTYYVKHLIR